MQQLYYIVLLIGHKVCFEKSWTKIPSKFLLSVKQSDNTKFSFIIIIINSVKGILFHYIYYNIIEVNLQFNNI